MEFYDFAKSNFEEICQYLYYLTDIMRAGGETAAADAIEDRLDALVDEYVS